MVLSKKADVELCFMTSQRPYSREPILSLSLQNPNTPSLPPSLQHTHSHTNTDIHTTQLLNSGRNKEIEPESYLVLFHFELYT